MKKCHDVRAHCRWFRTAAAGSVALLGLTAAQLIASAAAHAEAATVVSIDGTQMRVIGATGQSHLIRVTTASGTVIAEDLSGAVAAQPPCVVDSTHVAHCPAGSVSALVIQTGDGRDDVENRTTLRSVIATGAGDDNVSDGTGDDTVDLGPGDDGMFQGDGTDTVRGGPGVDIVSYEFRPGPVFVALDDVANDGPTGEADDVRSDVESVIGSNGNDTLIGSAADNDLIGTIGDDTLLGLAGNDLFGLPPGNLPSAAARVFGIPVDSGSDIMFGGPGIDTASYAASNDPVQVFLDDINNDGKAGAHGNAHSDIENIVGSRGNDFLQGSDSGNKIEGLTGNDAIIGLGGNDALDGAAGSDFLSGGTGVDTVSYAGRTAGIIVRLDDSSGDGELGENDNARADIENIQGGTGGDVLYGNDAANTLTGNGGRDLLSGLGGNDTLLGLADDDTVDGGLGTDTLSGGTGTDAVSYTDRTAAVTVRLDNAANDGQPGENDNARTDIENVAGGGGNDTLVGSNGPNLLSGGAGNDRMDGGLGGDDLSGGPGFDNVTYSGRSAPVAVRLDNLANDGQSGEGDNARTDVESVYGGAGGDTLVGSAANNELRGFAGNDVLMGAGGNDSLRGDTGADKLFGGAGVDTATYSERATAVTVRLDNLANDGQLGEADDARTDIENIVGGSGGDSLTGSAANNVLQGLAGNDSLFGLAGDDVLDGGAGTDRAFGGAGTDTCNTEVKDSCP